MIHPRRDLIIAIVLFIAGLAAFLWGLPDIIAGRNSAWLIASMIGGFIAVFALLMIPNFLWAMRLAGRMQAGEGLIAQWTVPAAQMENFIRWEKTQPWNHWRPTEARDTDIRFAPEYAMADGKLYTMPTSGPQAVRAVHWLEGEPPVLLFETATFVARGATVQTIATEKGRLRVPVGDRRAGHKVLKAYGDMLAGRTIVHPRRWIIRKRIAVVWFVLSAAIGLWGWWMAEATGWRVSDEDVWSLAPMVAMIAGLIFAIAAVVLYLLARAFHRRQLGRHNR
jgi:hypothetical protein